MSDALSGPLGMPGLLDLDAKSLKVMGSLIERLETTFGSHGYARVEPPVIDRPDIILERSGEDIRRRVYIFDDPGGHELCLRPEYTVPVCRLALKNRITSTAPLRLSYAGPVFRHQPPEPGRYRQFHQAGIELIGRGDPVAAEAEVLALAVAAAQAGGIESPLMILGDVRFFLTLLDHYGLPENMKIKLKRAFFRSPIMDSADPAGAPDSSGADGLIAEGWGRSEDFDSGTDPGDEPSEERAALMETVSHLGKERAVRLIESFLSVAEINAIGTRSIDEIVERLIDTSPAPLPDLSERVTRDLQSFLDIEDSPREALKAISAFARDTGAPFGPLIDAFERRLDLLDAHGVNLDSAILCTGLKRDIEYYTGFIFEIAQESGDRIWPLGGGGRYDQLLESLGQQTPEGLEGWGAAGFAIGIERLLTATRPEALERPVETRATLHARIRAVTPREAAAGAETAKALREAGWRVALDISGDGTQGDADEAAGGAGGGPAYLIDIETGPMEDLRLRIRASAEGTEKILPLTGLDSLVAGRSPDASPLTMVR